MPCAGSCGAIHGMQRESVCVAIKYHLRNWLLRDTSLQSEACTVFIRPSDRQCFEKKYFIIIIGSKNLFTIYFFAVRFSNLLFHMLTASSLVKTLFGVYRLFFYKLNLLSRLEHCVFFVSSLSGRNQATTAMRVVVDLSMDCFILMDNSHKKMPQGLPSQ
jgi:hypothetical protein